MWKKIVVIILILFAASFFLYRKTIFQEGNPAPMLSAVIKINLTGDEIVKIVASEDKYLTKSNGGREVIIEMLRTKGYKFIDQLGSGYIFENENKENLLVTH